MSANPNARQPLILDGAPHRHGIHPTRLKPREEPPLTIVKVSDFADAIRRLNLLPPGGMPLKDAALKYRAGDERLSSAAILDAVKLEFEACNCSKKSLVAEYDLCLERWKAASNAIDPVFERERRNAPGASPKELEALVKAAAPDLFEGAASAYKGTLSKEREIRGMHAHTLGLKQLFKRGSELLRLEKELEGVRLDCARLQEKIDLYPETAAKAEDDRPALELLVGSCKYYSELLRRKLSLIRSRNLAVEEVEKMERHGGNAGRGEVERIDGEIAKANEELRRMEGELRSARPSFITKSIGDIEQELKQELSEAIRITGSYQKALSADLALLKRLVKRSVDLEKKFVNGREDLLNELKKDGIIISS